jgi:DNA-binding transcriptional MerR regulator
MRTVGEVATLTNVTVRTLHHYDTIGLVRPSGRSAAGYRLDDQADLERLRTVLFYRKLGFPLEDWEEFKTKSEALTLRIAEVFRAGAAADSDRFSDCSHEMHQRLGEMYVTDPRFCATYEAIEPGLAGWVRDAIIANARRATD